MHLRAGEGLDRAQDRGPHRPVRSRSPGALPMRSPKVERRRSEGGTATVGRWNPPKDFRHLIGDLLDMSDFAPIGLAGLGSPVEGLTLTPTFKLTRPLRTAQ